MADQLKVHPRCFFIRNASDAYRDYRIRAASLSRFV